jgi:hypothetical protein
MPFATMQRLPQAAGGSRNVGRGALWADFFRHLGFYATLCGLLVSVLIYYGNTRVVFAADPERGGYPWDWSHEHLIFSHTDDPAVLAIIEKDPRTFHQWLNRNRTGLLESAPLSFDDFLRSDFLQPYFSFESPSADSEPRSESARAQVVKKRRDWGVSLGATHFSSVNANNAPPLYPAKYTFDITAVPNCTGTGAPPNIGDYVAFPTGAQGKTSTNSMTPNGQASIVIYNNLYSTQPAGGYCNTDGPSVYAAYVNVACPGTMSNDSILSSPVLSRDGTKIAWVTSKGNVQILTWGTGVTSSGAETVLAPACMGPGTGSDGSTLQSVTLGNSTHRPTSGVSFSALFVDYASDSAYVGDDDGYLHKISPFFTATGALQEVTAAAWQALHSYAINSLVLDTDGFIEKVTSCTLGCPGLSGAIQPHWSTTWNSTLTDGTVGWTNVGPEGGWPVRVTATASHTDNVKLNGPIFDGVSKNIFVGDANGSMYYILDPGTSTAVGSCIAGRVLYPCLGLPGTTSGITTGGGAQMDCSTAGPGPTCMIMSDKEPIIDSVTVDSANGLVIMQFSNADGTNATVEQTNTTLSVFNSATLAKQVNIAYHAGAFDNNYFNDPTSGYYYVCGPDSDGKETDLYRVGFTKTSGSIALGAVNGTPLKLTTTNNSGNCSPLTEIYNTSTATPKDWLFLSLDNNGKFPSPSGTGGCAGASCVLSFSLGNTMVTAPNSFYGSGDSGIAGMNGTGGMVVDNDALTTTYGGASSIYFMPVASNLTCGDGSTNEGCAVKLTQAGLK